MIDRSAAMPLYHQIYLELRNEIVSGRRPFGSALPTERALSHLYNVSRITARRVLSDLADEQFVERRRRCGTTVIFQPAKPSSDRDMGEAVDIALPRGRKTVGRILAVSRLRASADIAAALMIPPGRKVIRAIWLRVLGDVPLGHIVSHMPDVPVAPAGTETLDHAMILSRMKDIDRLTARSEQSICTVPADMAVAEALGVAHGATMLRIDRTMLHANRMPLLVSMAHYQSDRLSLRLELNGVPENP